LDVQVGRINGFIAKWQPLLLPGDWHVSHSFQDKPFSDEAANVDARVQAQWEYQNATVEWSVPVLADESDAVVEQAVVHEFVHIIIDQISPDVRTKDEERVVTALARAFMRVDNGCGGRDVLEALVPEPATGMEACRQPSEAPS